MTEHNAPKIDAIALTIFREIAAYLAEMPFSVYPPKSPYAQAVARIMLKPTPNPNVGRVDLFHKILGDWYAAGRSRWVMDWDGSRRLWRATEPLNFVRISDGGYCSTSGGVHSYYPAGEVADVPWCSVCAVPLRSLVHESVAVALCDFADIGRATPPDPSCEAFAAEMSAEIRRRNGLTRADAAAVAADLREMGKSRALFASVRGDELGGKLQKNGGAAPPEVSDRWLAENVAFVLGRAIAHAAPSLNYSILAERVRRKTGISAPKIAPYCFAVGAAIDRIIVSDTNHPLYDRAVAFEFGG